jgi:hypothetical protein
MATSLVSDDNGIILPSSNIGKAKTLAELAKRYKTFNSSYDFGNITYIASIRAMANGTFYHKGHLTDWLDCDNKQGNRAILKSTAPNLAGRTTMKNFIRDNLQANRPVIAITTIKTSYGDADNVNYISTNGGQGHFVVLTGVTENDDTNTYLVRFKDPWSNNSKTYEVNYTRFLNSMITYNTNYNAIALTD